MDNVSKNVFMHIQLRRKIVFVYFLNFEGHLRTLTTF